MAKRFVFVLACAFFAAALQARDLFRIIPESHGRVQAEALSQTQSVRVEVDVEVDKDALAEGDVTVPLGGKSYRVTQGRVDWTHHDETTSENVNDYVAHFTLENSQNPSMMLVWRGIASGAFVTPDNQTYQLYPDKGGYVLAKADASSFHCDVVNPETSSSHVQSFSSNASVKRRAVKFPDDSVKITLAEFYTPLAEAGAGGQAQIEATIQAAVAMANTAAHQSGVTNVTFELVYTGPLTWTDESNPAATTKDSLNFVVASSGAAVIRNQYQADLVGMWYEGGGGIAFAPASYRAFGPRSGFHTLGRVAGLLALAHEIGHNLGLQHDVLDTPAVNGEDFPFARGLCTMRFITIMASSKCIPNATGSNTNWIPYYSNIDSAITYDGQLMGIPNKAENVRMMRIGAPIVAAYGQQVSKSNP